MRRAGDRVADARAWSPAKGQRPGRRPLSALAVRRTIGKPSCAATIVLIGARKGKSRRLSRQKEARRPAARTPNLPSCPSPPAELPSRGESRRVSGTSRLSHTAVGRGNEPRSRKYLAQSSGWEPRGRRWGEAAPRGGRELNSAAVDAGRREAETSRRPAGSATFLRLTGGPPSCSGAGLLLPQSSVETANATPKPSVVTRPTALPPRR
jgi:hypothetical protein